MTIFMEFASLSKNRKMHDANYHHVSWTYCAELMKSAKSSTSLVNKDVMNSHGQPIGWGLVWVFMSRSGCVLAMNLFNYEAKVANLKLKTRPNNFEILSH
jgi:hypothetical protein